MLSHGDFCIRLVNDREVSLFYTSFSMSLSLPISNFTAERAELVNGTFIFHGVKVEFFAMSEAPATEMLCAAKSLTPEPGNTEDCEVSEEEADVSGLCTLIGDLTLSQGDKRARDPDAPEDGKAELKRSKR